MLTSHFHRCCAQGNGRRRSWFLAPALVFSLLLAACQTTKDQAGDELKQEPIPEAATAQPDSVVPPEFVEVPGPAEPHTSPFLSPNVIVDDSVKVGLLLPLSGAHARVGQALLNAAQLALFDIADERFTLIVRDTAGTPDGAQAAARSALDEGAELILGPLFSTSVSAVNDEAARSGVSVVTFSNNRAVAGQSTFVMGIGPNAQIARIIDFASARGLRRFAVLAPETPYGISVVEALQQAVARNDSELSRVIFYQPDADDLAPEVRSLADYDRRRNALLTQRKALENRSDEAAKLALQRLKDKETLGAPEFDAVLLPAGGEQLLSVASLLAYYEVDPREVRFLGTALWDDPSLGTEPALQGGWFPTPPPALWAAFSQRYEETYNESPPRVASLAYDAAALAAVLARRAAESTSRVSYSLQVLTQPSGFAGVDGIFRFLSSGESQRGLAVVEMQRDGFNILDAAPQTFEALTF